MNPFKWLFAAPEPKPSRSDAIRWWELRRIPYNILVGTVGLASVVVVEITGASRVEPGEDVVEPLALIFGILLFGIVANIAYTFGWILEIRQVGIDPKEHREFREKNFREGLAISCALAAVPLLLALLAFIANLL